MNTPADVGIRSAREDAIIADLKRSLKSTKINRDIHKGASKKYSSLLWDAQQTIKRMEIAQEAREQRIASLDAQLQEAHEEIVNLTIEMHNEGMEVY